MNPRSAWWLVAVFVLVLSPGRAQDVVITELMSSNDLTLVDEDDRSPDWIELFNAAAEPVSLESWRLTDDPADRAKWRFPARTIFPGEFLLVFASGKDRRRTEGELHTNFRLSSGGEYLALIRADGSVASEFRPSLPAQPTDVSYGFTMETDSRDLLGPGAGARYLVPDSDALGTEWTAIDFDDAGWKPATIGIGFDRRDESPYDEFISTDIEADMHRVNSSVFIRVPFRIDGPVEFDMLMLTMRFEDGFVAYLNGVEIERFNAPDELAFDSRATSSNNTAPNEVEFNISRHGELLREGDNVLAFHGLNFTTSNGDFLLAPSIRSDRILSVARDAPLFFTESTPGLPNRSQGFPGVVPAPVPSQSSGTFVEAFDLGFSVDAAGAVIRYTVNGGQPTEDSTVFTDPIPIDVTSVVRARAFQPDRVPSPTLTLTYIAIDQNAADFDSNLPIVIANPFGAPNGSSFIPAYVATIETAGGRTGIVDTPGYIGPAGMKRRGSSSSGWPKGNYGLEIWDARGNDEDASLLGMPAESDWVLHGPYSDKSLMRNVLAMEWSNNIGRYAARTRFCELFLNERRSPKIGMAHYWGVYVLMEKIKLGENRVDIEKLYPSETAEPEVTGGYVLKKDRNDPGDSGFAVPGGPGFAAQTLLYVDPKERGPRSASAQQKAWLRGWFTEFARSLAGQDFADPENGYAKYIDVGAFIDHHLLTELCKNIDGYRLSTFMFKDRDGKLNMGPLWDFNLSLRNADYLEGWKSDGWYYRLISSEQYPWYPRLFADPGFQKAYSDRWIELRADEFSIDKLIGSIDQHTELLGEASVRNFQKWRILGRYLWPNPNPLARTFNEEVELMKDWLIGRVLWMDSQLVPAPVLSPDGGLIPEGGLELTMEGPPGSTIFYTLDGSDPRSRQGQQGDTAIEYRGPVMITRNTVVKARILLQGLGGGGLAEAIFLEKLPPILITELMYNPPEPPPESPFRSREFEFIELHNASDQVVSLADVRFARGVTFRFNPNDAPVLGPREYGVIVANREAFVSLHGDGMTILGEFSGSLSDNGELIELEGPIDAAIPEYPYARFRYDDDWYPETDGNGHSLVLVDPDIDRELLGEATSWRPSIAVHGSPGRADVEVLPGLQVPGDVDQSGVLNVTDGVLILGILFGGRHDRLPCEGSLESAGNTKMLDIDGNRDVNLADAVSLLNYLFLRGDPPALGTDCVPVLGCPSVCAEE